MQPQQEETFIDRMKATTSLAIFFAKIFSLPSELLLHEDVGERYIGLPGGFAFLLLMFFPVLFQHSNPVPLLVLLFAVVFRCFCHRTKALWNWFKGRPRTGHTKRPGTPWAMRLLPNWSVQTVYWLEPFFCILLGIGVAFLSLPLGVYLFLSGLGLLTVIGLRYVAYQTQINDMHDCTLESQVTAEGLRSVQGR